MCGIAGTVAPGGVDPRALEAMGEAIRHRGPDGSGYLFWSPGAEPRLLRKPKPEVERPVLGLAHRRLSIIDLGEHNDQPQVGGDGSLALSFNGEIYNYLELRTELESLGHSFRTSGDTEVVLASYAEWGPACVERFVGMWALAMLDARRRTLLLSRDRFGIKPLYYAQAGGSLHFASEIKALLRAPGLDPRPDAGVVRRYLLTGAVDETDDTFFEGIRSLPAAHNALVLLDASGPAVTPERYWSIPEEGYDGDRQAAAREFAETFSESVRVHVRSDVPVGTCLSGGLDSSAIVCVADRLRGGGELPHYAHHGFGYVPEDAAMSERRYMDAVVRRTGLDMTYVEVDSERFADSLVAIARQQDEPFGSTSIAAQYFVFEAARNEGMKVMLDGQGADEILAGYHHYFPMIAVAMLRRHRYLGYLRFSRAQRRARGAPPISARHALATLSPRGASDAIATRIVDAPVSPLLSRDLRSRTTYRDFRSPEFGSAHELLAAATTSMGLPALLRYEDRNSMAHSIEARVPFLDHRLVELCFRLPFDYKLNGASTKDVMRRALRDVLPEEVLERQDKIGFRAEPTAAWSLAVRHREALLESRTPYEREWLDPQGLAAMLDGADRSAGSEFALWRAINLKLWLRSFWGDGADPLRA